MSLSRWSLNDFKRFYRFEMCVSRGEFDIVLHRHRRDPEIVLRNRSAFLFNDSRILA